MKLQSTWTTIGKVRVHARVATVAPAEAPRVVLVHGIGVASRDFVPLAERLAPHAHVYAVDRPGFGRSGHPRRTLTIPQLAAALAAWLDAIGPERVVQLGNSVGCQIAAHLAARAARSGRR
jgi:pimeloyl-ACP methyl ester carboxylesterase